MLRAQSEGIEPEELIRQVQIQHEQDFADFSISFDNFYSTHSEENKQLAESIYLKLRDNGHISSKVIKQAYDPEKNMFLPDRFVIGECPKCGASDQYGDNCEVCSATYSPIDLKNPRSAVSGATPIEKESEHIFFTLSDFQDDLKQWIRDGHIAAESANKLDELFESGLHDWDISRDKPYFGFEIPDSPVNIFMFGLMRPWVISPASKTSAIKMTTLNFDEYMKPESETELYHFIGKDIISFHALFWPAVLAGANLRTPTAIYAHGFLTVNGQKMSKSRGTFINARHYLNHPDPEYLRYYFAAKLTSRVDDLDLNLDDFLARVNSDLVGKVVNIASRCAGFIYKRYDGQLSIEATAPELFQQLCRSEEHTSELQSPCNLVCRLLLEKKNKTMNSRKHHNS